MIKPRGKARKWALKQRVALAKITPADIITAKNMLRKVSPKLYALISAPRVK